MSTTAEERVFFANSRGQRLAGILKGPVAEAMVISCHGMLSAKNGLKHKMLAAELEKRGLGSLRFDFAGRGESEGDLWDLSISNEVVDLDAALTYLSQRGVKRFGVFGSSMGGSVALLTAARDERIVAVATLAAVAHPDAIAERQAELVDKGWKDGYLSTAAGKISMRFVEDARQHDVVAAVRVLCAPVHVTHGDRDEVVPVSDAHDIATAARNAQLNIVFGADHRFTDPTHLRPAIGSIAEFLAATLADR